jgi:hypothetical protein
MPRISAVRQYPFLLSLLTAFCFLALVLRPALASEPSAPKYDFQTETKIKGTVQDVSLPASGHEKDAVHLVLKIGDDAIDVYLCPKSFLDEMGVAFNKGDEIAVTGSKVKSGVTDLVLARQAQKGNDTLILRDDKGNPVWVWSSKK